MKKTTALFVILFIGLATTFNSCKKGSDTSTVNMLKATYLGSSVSFPTGMAMYSYPSLGYSLFDGTEAGTVTSLTVKVESNTTGTFDAGNGQTSYIQLIIGNITYISNIAGGSGTVKIAEFNNTTMWAQGTFSGTLVQTNNPSNTISMTQGQFNIHFQ